MGKKTYYGFYQLPKDYQKELDGLYPVRHIGSWAKKEDAKTRDGAVAIIKSYGIYWDYSIPLLVDTARDAGLVFNIVGNGFNHFLIVFYKPQQLPDGKNRTWTRAVDEPKEPSKPELPEWATDKCAKCIYYDETGGIAGEPYCSYSTEGDCGYSPKEPSDNKSQEGK